MGGIENEGLEKEGGYGKAREEGKEEGRSTKGEGKQCREDEEKEEETCLNCKAKGYEEAQEDLMVEEEGEKVTYFKEANGEVLQDGENKVGEDISEKREGRVNKSIEGEGSPQEYLKYDGTDENRGKGSRIRREGEGRQESSGVGNREEVWGEREWMMIEEERTNYWMGRIERVTVIETKKWHRKGHGKEETKREARTEARTILGFKRGSTTNKVDEGE